jgi:hypothetical protein
MIRVSANSRSVFEGGDSGFTISASSAADQPVTVTYGLGGTAHMGSDYTVGGEPVGQVVIPAGETSVTIPLHAMTDGARERGENVKIRLNNGVGYRLPRTAAGKSASIKILNVP